MTHAFILLHGFTGSPESWRQVLESLPSDAPRSAPALLGHAGSDSGSQSFEEEVDRLAAVAAELPQPRHLAGYSLGARVALGMLVRHPSLFARATLIGANPGLGQPAEREARQRSDGRWVDLLEQRGLEAFLDEWRALPMWKSQELAPAHLLEAQRRINRSHAAAGLARSLRVLGLAAMPDWTPHLAALRVPVTLMTGALDTKFEALADGMAAIMPLARRLTVAAAGHNLLIERPEAVADVLNQEDDE